MKDFSTWKELFFASFGAFLNVIVQALPSFLGALILLLIGWLVAKSLSFVVLKLLLNVKFDRLIEKPPLSEYFAQANLKAKPSEWVRKLVYWTVYLLFIVIAAETLGLEVVSTEISKLISYLPRLFAALLIFGIGVYIISFVRDFIRAATATLSMSAGKFISGFVFYILLIILGLTTLKQAGMDTDIITTNLTLIMGAIFFSFALGYGFASRDILSNILATFFSRRVFQLGQTIEVANVKGKIIEISSISVRLQTDEGEVIVPSNLLIKNKVKILK
ncbi:MAG: hypothetical protein OHK0053_07890 [Microscillaceae bacterium]